MAATDDDVYAQLDRQLNSSAVPLAERFRALFTLKSLGGHRAIEVIAKGEPILTVQDELSALTRAHGRFEQVLMAGRHCSATSWRTASDS